MTDAIQVRDEAGEIVAVLDLKYYGQGSCHRCPTDELSKAESRSALIAKAPELLDALRDILEHCALVHKHWGEGDNTKEADAAESKARALLAELGTGDGRAEGIVRDSQ